MSIVRMNIGHKTLSTLVHRMLSPHLNCVMHFLSLHLQAARVDLEKCFNLTDHCITKVLGTQQVLEKKKKSFGSSRRGAVVNESD